MSGVAGRVAANPAARLTFVTQWGKPSFRTVREEVPVGSKDKAGKPTKKAASRSLKEKRAAKKAKRDGSASRNPA